MPGRERCRHGSLERSYSDAVQREKAGGHATSIIALLLRVHYLIVDALMHVLKKSIS